MIGTFSGGGAATSTSTGTTSGPQAQVKGRIAQYFATGIAAQLLAEKGGAALVNSAAPPASSGVDPKEVEKVKQDTLTAIENADKVATHVFKGADETERKKLLTTAFEGIPIGDNEQSTREMHLTALAKIPDKDKLKNKLVNSYSRHVGQMANNIK